LGLSGFFPIVKPVQPITPTGKRVPVCPYAVYEKLAKELDDATRRINKIMQGLKVRGAIAGDGDIATIISSADDNEIVTVHNIENIVAAGGLEKAVMWWPIDMAVAVLQQLYVQREQIKDSIYEITGISDIVRGQSTAAETATAQQIKTEWGSLRIKKMQKLIQRQARDIIKLTIELMSKHFSVEAIQKAAGMQFSPEAQQILSQPIDHFRIDIETDSTIEAEQQKDQQNITELLTGITNFMQSVAEPIQSGVMTVDVAKAMLLAAVRRFRLGRQVEDAIESIEQPQQQGPQGVDPAEVEKQVQQIQQKYQQQADKQVAEAQAKLNEECAAYKQKCDMEKKALEESMKLAERERNLENERKLFELQKKLQAAEDQLIKAKDDAELKAAVEVYKKDV
jgi:hypothetical protein